MSFFRSNKHIILYGAVLAILIFLLKWLQWKFLILDHSIEIYVGLVALLFTIMGFWIANQMTKTEVIINTVEKQVFVPSTEIFVLNETALLALDLSTREYEVLQLMEKGYSNAEIAEQLFLSLSTIKTHVSNLYQKMDVKSRTQAIGKAKALRIIA
ncbi:MAG TPA: response regulator transcription factor [Saprospiraceae bacterium]|nr:response regulator transcription factor [Saprospiraceae bacterium]